MTHSAGIQLEEAVRAAGKIGLRKAGATIRKLATSNETERDLRLEAIRALALVDTDSFDVLEKLSDSNDREIAEVAEETLDELTLSMGLDDDLDEE